MKKVAWIHAVPQNQILDILRDEIKQLKQKHDEVLTLAIEQYIGRKFDIELDKNRIELISVIGSNDTTIQIDGVNIGIMNHIVAYNNDDFIQNNISIAISFTPTIELIHHNENKTT